MSDRQHRAWRRRLITNKSSWLAGHSLAKFSKNSGPSSRLTLCSASLVVSPALFGGPYSSYWAAMSLSSCKTRLLARCTLLHLSHLMKIMTMVMMQKWSYCEQPPSQRNFSTTSQILYSRAFYLLYVAAAVGRTAGSIDAWVALSNTKKLKRICWRNLTYGKCFASSAYLSSCKSLHSSHISDS